MVKIVQVKKAGFMGISKTIPQDSRFIQTVNTFTALFNVPSLGQYNFVNGAVNENIAVLSNLQKNHIYMIEKYSFSATIPEGAFLEATANVCTFQLLRSIDKQVVYQAPIPLINYIDGQSCVGYFWAAQDSDVLIATFRGLLNQPAALVGVASIIAQVTLNIYEISDTDWIQSFKQNTGREYSRRFR